MSNITCRGRKIFKATTEYFKYVVSCYTVSYLLEYFNALMRIRVKIIFERDITLG